MKESTKSLPFYLLVVSILAGLLPYGSPASALTLEQVPEGYIVRLSAGESVVDGWWAIHNERRRVGAPEGVRDIIELGEGVFPMNDVYGNYLTHYRSSNSDPQYPPLVIRGTGPSTTYIRCMNNTRDAACAVSHEGLTFEDLGILNASTKLAPIVRTVRADLTLRRVHIVGQDITVDNYQAAIDVFRANLTIEDSVLSGNQVTGGFGLILYQSWDPLDLFKVSRSTIANNTVNAVFELSSYEGAKTEIEQSTLVNNTAQFLFRGSYDEPVSISRSIVTDLVNTDIELTVLSSFTDADPQLQDDGLGVLVPSITSPVIDGLPCDAGSFDQRGEPTGVQASYFEARTTACDYGAVEAQHQFCLATSQGKVVCDEGEIDLDQVTSLGCRLIGGLLDCTGGQEVELTFLDFGESIFLGDAQLVMQLDGNLVLYQDGNPTWATATNLGPCIGHFVEVQADGTLMVFSDPDAAGGAQPCYSNQTPGYRVVLREGFRREKTQIVVEEADGSMVNVFPYQDVSIGQSLVAQGSVFRPNHSLSIDGALAVLQGDGNFVLYEIDDDVWTPTWATGTYGSCTGRNAYFQPDGNLVIGAPGMSCFGATNPLPGGTVLRLHRTPLGTATLTLYSSEGDVLWSEPQS